MRTTVALMLAALPLLAQPAVVTIPNKNPIVTFRMVFRTGAAADPKGQEGAAAMVASMLSEGGTRELTYKQIVGKLFPMAGEVSAQVDKEMITFSGATHVDNLEAFYKLFQSMLLDPGWRPDDLERHRDNLVNYLRVSLRGTNDEELGKEVLYNEIYRGTRYGHNNYGTVSSLKKLSAADLQKFYKANFTQANLIIGLAGGMPSGFAERVKKDFAAKLPAGDKVNFEPPQPPEIEGRQVTIVEKNTRSIAYSFGFPLDVRRGHPDYPALLVAQSYFGQHRNSGGRLYQRMRQERGLNYGNYAYIEYFPQGMFRMEPAPNLGRSSQVFQIWIRPLEPPTAVFGLRLAMFELDNFIENGLSEEVFQRTRSFVQKYTNLLTKTNAAELGYLIDSRYYGIPDYGTYIQTAVAKLTRDDVNRAIRKHLQSSNMHLVVVTQGAEDLKRKLLSGEPSPMTYNSPKPEAILAEDKVVERYPLKLKEDAIRIVPVDRIFE
jgi:zinc protease